MPDISSFKEQVVLACRILHKERLVQSVGHLSARIPGTDTFVIPPRRSAGLVTPADLLVMGLDGQVLAGDREPNSEWPIHSEIYRARPDVGAVAHIHPFYTIALGSLGEPLRPVHNWGATFGDGVGYFDEICYIRDQDQGARHAAALGSRRAVLLRGHGATVVGSDVINAVVASLELEYNAHLQMVCLSAGKPQYFTQEESARIIGHPPRLWEYYVAHLQGELDQPLPGLSQPPVGGR